MRCAARGRRLEPLDALATTTHVRRYLRRYRSSGRVWHGRFKAFPAQEDEHLLVVLRYIERNPLRAGLVERAEAWPGNP
jgi:putative transposase